MSRREDDPPVKDIESEEESSDESSNEETPDEPATPSITNQSLPEVTSQLDNLHLEMGDNSNLRGRQQTPAPTGDRTAMPGGAATKVNPPTEFTGRRDQIKSFRLQCKLYWEMNPDKFSNNQRNKLLFAMSYLRGKALEWIQPHMEDFIDHPTGAGANARTLELLRNDTVFFEALKETFDVGNDTLEADRDLRALRQKTSAAAYRAEFSILAAKVGWNDDALASQFYRGLKEQVRVEITMRHKRPSTLKDMADLAIEIDSRIFEVQMEKKGNYFQGRANTKAQREVPAWKDNYYGLQKMQLDATNGRPGSDKKGPKKGQSPQTNKGMKDKSNVECYGCGKKGHYKNECNARKQRHELQDSGPSKRDREFRATKGKGKTQGVVEIPRVEYNTPAHAVKATQGRGAYDMTGTEDANSEQDKHNMMSWTACYDNDCLTHLGDKEGSGWFPTGKRHSICRTSGGPGTITTEIVRYPAGYPPQEESSEEEDSSEEGEVSDGDETDDVEIGQTSEFTRVADSNDVTLMMMALVWDSKNLVVPWDAEGNYQRVNESELWELLTRLRRLLWNMPHEKHGTDYYRIVQEFPPLGSRFTPRGGYFTKDNICISQSIRSRVQQLKKDYAEEQQEQIGRTQELTGERESAREARPILPVGYMEEPLAVRTNPRSVRNRPPTPYQSDLSTWEPPLNTSDPNYVPRRDIRMQGTSRNSGN